MNEKNGYVKWKVYVWTVSVITILFSYSFSQINKNGSKLDDYNFNLTEIKVQLSQIQTDIEWIKNN